MYSDEGLVDLGIAQRIDVDGRGAITKLMDGKFVTTYWAWAMCDGVWVRAPALYLVKPMSCLLPGGWVRSHLAKQNGAIVRDSSVLHS